MTEQHENIVKTKQEIVNGIGMFGGNDFVVTASALAETEVRLFPESKYRSKRIRKKLLKRFGGEFKKEPSAFKIGNRVIIHPVLYRALMERVPERPKPQKKFLYPTQ